MSLKISVIIPTYNQCKYISETLDSVINQTYQNWECIIIDDGSTDETSDVVNSKINVDNRFRYIKKENGGASSARNLGLDLASGDYIQFLDSDDFLYENKFLKNLEDLSTNSKHSVSISNFKMFIDSIKKPLPAYCNLSGKNFNFNSILLDWDINYTIPLHCGLFRKSLFDNVRFDETIQSKEDWIMWITVLLDGASISFIDEVLVLYRINDLGNHTNDESNYKKANIIVYNLIDESSKIKLFEKELDNSSNRLIRLKKCQMDYVNLEKRKSKLKRLLLKFKK